MKFFRNPSENLVLSSILQTQVHYKMAGQNVQQNFEVEKEEENIGVQVALSSSEYMIGCVFTRSHAPLPKQNATDIH